MENLSMKQRFQLLLTPVLMVVLGAVLLVRPDSASALVGTVLGWLLIAVGVVCALYAAKVRDLVVLRALPAIACFAVGVWMLKHPLALAAALGRIAGLLIALQGVQDIINAKRWKCGMSWAIATAAMGAVLVLLPMTASRLVLGACGLALVVMGGLEAWGRMRLSTSGGGESNVFDNDSFDPQ